MSEPFWGKYRARVDDNDDPYKLGRLKLKVPDVFGSNTSGWALPSFPYASAGLEPGSGVGLFLIPPKDAWVWAEFEHGDPERPLWTGCFFPADLTSMPVTMSALLPLVGIDPKKQVLKAGEWVITISDDTLTFEHLLAIVPRKRLKLSGTDVVLSTELAPSAGPPACAQISLSGIQTSINGDALEVM
jgi:hypothetical protein